MATATATYIPETIKLQLRKPKSWNWELSTSKSSPSIILPVIQLYDYKGHLLVEAKDTGSANVRTIWQDVNKDNSRKSRSVSRSGCTSSIESLKRAEEDGYRNFITPSIPLDQLVAANLRKIDTKIHTTRRSKSEAQIREKNHSKNRAIRRSLVEDQPRLRSVIEAEGQIQGEGEGSKNRKKNDRSRTIHSLENVMVDANFNNVVLENLIHTKRYTTRTSSAGTLIIPKETFREDQRRRKRYRHRRDELQTLNHLNESQGADTFISKSIRDLKYLKMKRSEREKRIRQSSDPTSLLSREKVSKHHQLKGAIQENQRNLIEKSVHGLSHSQSDVFLHQKLLVNGHDYSIGAIPNTNIYDRNENYNQKKNHKDETEVYSKNGQTDKNNYQDRKDNYRYNKENYYNKHSQDDFINQQGNLLNKNAQNVNFLEKNDGYNKTDFRRDNNVSNHNKNDSHRYKRSNYRDINHNYRDKCSNCRGLLSVLKNPIKTRSCEFIDLPLGGKSDQKFHRKFRSRTLDRTMSYSSEDTGKEYKKGHLIKEHSAAQREKQASDGSAASTVPDPAGKDANDLLKLVRKLFYSHSAPKQLGISGAGENGQQVDESELNMGANVSRHSAKGLGRRSQSSGSICNGGGSGGSGKSGRHPEGKICSSLPSYLENREKNGACNNNHDRKHPIDEDRIPPLGDSAPLHWKFSDTHIICDQGYGSERSPEEEYPPPLNSLDPEALQCHHHLEPHACYPFITPDSTFLVKLTKGSRGLGLSVTGGIDSTGSWPGLIRIKRLFPHQPASSCGLLNVGDLLLEANGIALTGLTNYEALEVLRTAPNHVELKVCRPPPDVLNCVSPISEVPPPPPRREPPNSLNLPSNSYTVPEDDYYNGEFEITLKKIQGSLGFTLRKEDDSALGHYVRALVREPALTDGRIKAGDKIIAVNDVEICPMSHEQAVQFLRQCPEIVKLRLYRDCAQTPIATLSSTETTPRTSFSRKAHLRQEAVDMLNDLAGRKLVEMNQEIYNRSLSPSSSPTRRRRRQPFPSDASQGEYVEEHVPQTEYLPQCDQPSQSGDYLDYQEQFHEGIIQNCPRPFDEDAFNSLFSMESDDGDKPNRPSSLELYNPNQTPVATRKPRFNFSLAHNAYELNNLDAEVLDAPNLTYNLCNEDVKTSDSEVQEPVSMPHIPTNPSSNFSHKHPAYQSAHPQINTDLEHPQTQKPTSNKADEGTLKKKKNAPQQENKENVKSNNNLNSQRMPMKEEYEVLAIELNRGWNSRLGFSLQGAAGVTYVSAVHADSVAARDGRLKPGDRLIKVNDESIEHMTTNEIIDLLRIVRGPVCIVISRVKRNEDCPKSNAEN